MKIIIFIFLLMSLCACSNSHNAKNTNKNEIITVASHPFATTLYYSGTVQPLKAVVVTSPAEGVIEDMAFHYGDTVKPQQLLFTISSNKFESDYKSALMQYIKAKTDFENASTQLREGEFLHKNLLISDDDFKAKQTNFYNAQLMLLQARDTLATLLKQLDMPGLNLYALTIADIDKITQALHIQSDSQKIRITSPAAGVILLPTKNDSGDNGVKKISRGEQVKQGDVLAMIGDVSGLTIHINVNEFNINQIHIGQTVKVTGAAFPDFVLEGEIAGLDRQGQPSQGGMPIFPVEVIVPTLTPQQQAVIHMGMNAKVEIAIEGTPEVTVPIAAVFEKSGVPYVRVQNEKNGKIQEIAVKTGQTTLDSVVIKANLKTGDKVVVPH